MELAAVLFNQGKGENALARIRTGNWLDEDFDPNAGRRKAARAKGLRGERDDRYSDRAVMDDILLHAEDPDAQAAAFTPTYQGSRYERVWILMYLGPFYDRRLISDVLRKVKGGKEATVYCCRGGSASPQELVAAKVYRPRQFRNLRNDALYRQGREVLGPRGQPLRDRRALLAIRMGTRKGKEMEHVSWLAHEYAALQALHAAGVPVPQPIAFANNTVLMEYFGEVGRPAPTLQSVTLQVGEARELFAALLRDVETMLAHGTVHADLSAFNVLYRPGAYRIIDFPQAVDPVTHGAAYPLFERDVTRLCQYFARYGIAARGPTLARQIWERHMTDLV
jgi:RIO kinase 1